MPNIPTYDQPNINLQPSEVGIEAHVQSAYRGRALYDEAASGIDQAGRAIGGGIAAAGAAAVQVETHQQVQAGAAHSVQMFDTLSRSKDDAIKAIDPNDPAYAAKVETAVKQWREQTLEPTLDQFQSGFVTEEGQQWAQRAIDNTRQHLFIQSAADISTAAKIGITNSVNTIGTSASNAAIRDPASVDALMAMTQHSIDGLVSSSLLSGTDAARVRSEVVQDTNKKIVQGAAFGAINKAADPEAAAAAFVAKYPQYINGQEAETLAKAAKVQSRQLQSADRQSLIFKNELANQAVDAERNRIWSENVTTDPSGKVTINPSFFKEVAQIPTKYMDAPKATDTAKTLLDWGEHQSKQPEKFDSDPATVSDLTTRMFDPDHPVTQIDLMKANVEKKLSDQDFQRMDRLVKTMGAEQLKDPVLHTTMDGVKQFFEARGTQADGFGAMSYARFAQVFVPEYLAEQRGAKLPPDALNMNDPNSLIRRSMAPFNGSLTDAVHRLATGQSAFAPPQNQGWQFNPKRQQYRDPSGAVYDLNGKPVKQ